MAGTQESKQKRKGASSAGGKASALLKEDHQRVLDMFKEYEKLKSDGGEGKEQLAEKICSELKVHTRIEEEIFYPAMRENSDEMAMINEAEVEHASAKQLIHEIETMRPGDRLFDARVKVLGEYVRHHIKEEEKEMFPAAKKAGIDTAAMAEDLKQRKQELQRQLH